MVHILQSLGHFPCPVETSVVLTRNEHTIQWGSPKVPTGSPDPPCSIGVRTGIQERVWEVESPVLETDSGYQHRGAYLLYCTAASVFIQLLGQWRMGTNSGIADHLTGTMGRCHAARTHVNFHKDGEGEK